MADVSVEEEAAPERDKEPAPRRSPLRFAVPIVVAALAVAGYFVWSALNRYESTDDAEIDGHVHAVSARIGGNVVEVDVDDQQAVKAGDVLARIDPRDCQVAVAKAEADLADAMASLRSAQVDVPITSTNTASQLTAARSSRLDADAGLLSAQRSLSAAKSRLASARARVREAEANESKAKDDLARYKMLVDKDEISRQQYNTAAMTAAVAKATLDSRRAAGIEAEQNVTVAEAAVEQSRARISQAGASVEAALTAPQQVQVSEARVLSAAARVKQRQALLDQAKLNLAYTTITAPVAGIVGKKTVEAGQNVSPGQQLLAVVQLDDVWVTANFKETQLRRIRPGQKVKIQVDADGRDYTGKVTGIGGASGARFSLLPPENATGNYVKVVQRLPVRIDLDPGQNGVHLLRPGMSVIPKVYVE